MNTLQPLLNTLRSETNPSFDRIAAAPFFTAGAQSELPVESYILFLSAYRSLIEASLSSSPKSSQPWFHSITTQLKTRLVEDLAVFQPWDISDNPRVTLATLALTERVRARYMENPGKLLGYISVLLETAILENLEPAVLADQFKLPPETGFTFLGAIHSTDRDIWSGLSDDFSESLSEESTEADALAAALRTAAGLDKLFQALHPLETKKYRNLVTEINPSAGTHAIPDDPQEIRAAIRAGEITLMQTPYFEWRFGDRANKFAHSDSAWLTALTRLNESAFNQQIDWLARLLAPRGMPQWILERHLGNLHAELIRFCPENKDQYQKITNLVEKMRAEREQRISADDFAQLAEEFERKVKSEWPGRSRNAGKILVAAVADEAGGIKNAMESVQGWMTDPARFSAEWIAAVETTLQMARARVIS